MPPTIIEVGDAMVSIGARPKTHIIEAVLNIPDNNYKIWNSLDSEVLRKLVQPTTHWEFVAWTQNDKSVTRGGKAVVISVVTMSFRHPNPGNFPSTHFHGSIRELVHTIKLVWG